MKKKLVKWHWSICEPELKEYFEKYAEVESINLKLNQVQVFGGKYISIFIYFFSHNIQKTNQQKYVVL